MATRILYPTFRRLVRHLNTWLSRNQGEMVRLCAITEPNLTQLQNLRAALDAIAGDHSAWPPYNSVP